MNEGPPTPAIGRYITSPSVVKLAKVFLDIDIVDADPVFPRLLPTWQRDR